MTIQFFIQYLHLSGSTSDFTDRHWSADECSSLGIKIEHSEHLFESHLCKIPGIKCCLHISTIKDVTVIKQGVDILIIYLQGKVYPIHTITVKQNVYIKDCNDHYVK